ncbi:MAG: hypothetical protein K0S34_665 [Bacillales bacterium]|jgi:hypothetical protein|nr:hypothetical protein [Bacillales bacterium]
MEKFIMTTASMIILIPILLFLPFGLNRKGKLLIGILSYIIASLGVLSSFVYSYEITIVLLLSLIIVITFIFSRMPRLFFDSVNKKSKKDLRIIKSVQVKTDLDIVSKVFIKEELENELEEQNVIVDVEPVFEEIIQMNEEPVFEEVVIELDNSSDEVGSLETDHFEEIQTSDNLSDKNFEDITDVEWEEDVSFLTNRSDEQSLSEVQEVSDEIKVENYMSEIEQLIASEDVDEELVTSELDRSIDDIVINEDIEIEIIDDLIPDLQDSEEDDLTDLWEEIAVETETNNNKGINF